LWFEVDVPEDAMIALQLPQPQDISKRPLEIVDRAIPRPGRGQLLVRVRACGVCHTDLHLVEGDIMPPKYPVIPGHQVVGVVEALGKEVSGWSIGDRVGLFWLHHACGECEHCLRGEENLCSKAAFTGFHVDGGFAEYVLAEAGYALVLPETLSDEAIAPLLCAGIIGYRSLRKADLQPGERLGLIGFGASAHLAIQIALHWGCEVYVFTRSAGHRKLAKRLGASWIGGAEDRAPKMLDRAVIFAPAGELVPVVLEKLRPGGTLAINAIHLSPIPEMPYRLIYGERTLRSVANATYSDGVAFLRLAAEIPVRATTRTYALREANQALEDLKESRIDGAGVLLP
jgi:propanol-preferring alcohol dehydrogenase